MHRTGMILAALLLAPAPAVLAASRDASFDAFAQVCADTHEDYAAIAAAAQANGWTPAEVRSSTLDKVTVAETLSRGRKAGGVDLTLFAWRGATKAGVQVTGCTVRVSKSDAAADQAAVQAWLAFAPQVADTHKAVFHFTEADGGRKAIDSSQFDAAAAGSGLQILTVSRDANGAVLDLLKLKK